MAFKSHAGYAGRTGTELTNRCVITTKQTRIRTLEIGIGTEVQVDGLYDCSEHCEHYVPFQLPARGLPSRCT